MEKTADLIRECSVPHSVYLKCKACGAEDPHDVRKAKLYEIDDSDMQMILCSLALCSLLRPGWVFATDEVAQRLGSNGKAILDQFREYNPDIKPQGER